MIATVDGPDETASFVQVILTSDPTTYNNKEELKNDGDSSRTQHTYYYESVVPRLNGLLDSAQEISALYAVEKCAFCRDSSGDNDASRNIELGVPNVSDDTGLSLTLEHDDWVLVTENNEMQEVNRPIDETKTQLAPHAKDETLQLTSSRRMPSTTHLKFPDDLPKTIAAEALSVMTYNVLLPNSCDTNGWHIFKSYYPPVASSTGQEIVALWEFRKNLIRKKIERFGHPDIVCLQEVAPETFNDDFDFLRNELGYDGVALYRKGRMRPATFWKTSKCTLVEEPVHKDRCLLTCFQLNNHTAIPPRSHSSDSSTSTMKESSSPNWHVINCHLSAGPSSGPRRLRQVHDSLTAAVKLERKLCMSSNKGALPTVQEGKRKQPAISTTVTAVKPNIILCGDFNGDDDCAAVRYMKDGLITKDFMEHGEVVSSKGKTLPEEVGSMTDVVLQAAKGNTAETPPTLVVPEFISFMVEQSHNKDDNNEQMSKGLLRRLVNIFISYASHPDGVMTRSDVKRWLMTINGRTREGNEFEAAASRMGSNDTTSPEISQCNTLPLDGVLTLEDFLSIYEEELKQGLYWSIAHDLALLGKPIVPVENPETLDLFKGRFDRMYCSSSTLHPTCVVSSHCDKPCPNDVEPSDHLPLAASFILK